MSGTKNNQVTTDIETEDNITKRQSATPTPNVAELIGGKYIELKGKIPAENFNVFVEDISKLEDAGVIIPNDIVLVDFDDNYNIALKILNKYPTLAIKTTRGLHLYYKIPDGKNITNTVHTITGVGVPVDYKTGHNNKKSLGVLKQEGIHRTILNTIKSKEDIPVLPFELYPILKSKEDLVGLGDGDGRNSTLYKHILNILESVTNDNVNVAHIIEFINNNVFAEPLLEQEINATVESAYRKYIETSNSPMSKDFWTADNKIDIHKLAEYLTRVMDIKLYNGFLYFKKDNKYLMNINNNLIREVYKNKNINLKLKKRDDAELVHQLSKTAEDITENQYFPIEFRNGFVLDGEDIHTLSGVFTPFQMNVDYIPDAYDETVDNFLNWFATDHKTNTCKQDIRLVLEDMLGHILMTSSFPHKVFFFVGASGNNGKSTMLTMLSNFTGELSSALALEEFGRPENLYTLLGKIVNLGDDIDDTHIQSSRSFKTLAAGNTIMIKKLYEMPRKLTNTATLIFSCNGVPNFKDKSGGIARRMAIIPCDNIVTEINLKIDQLLSTDNAKSYLLNLAIKGMRRIIENGGKLSTSETVDNIVNSYLKDSDSVLSYLDDFNVDGMQSKQAYRDYEMFCSDSGIKPYSQNKFTRRLKELDYDSKVVLIKNKSERVFVKLKGD